MNIRGGQGLVGLQLCDDRIILVLTNIELRFQLIVLQIVIFQLRLVPVHGKKLVRKIRQVGGSIRGNVLDQIAQILPDVLELVDAGSFQIVRVQDLVDELALHHDFRDVGNGCDGSDLFVEVCSGLGVLFAHEICQLDAIHQRVEAHRLGVVCIRRDQRRQFIADLQGVFVSEGCVVVRIGIQLYVLQVLADGKAFCTQFPHLADHILHQRLAERD